MANAPATRRPWIRPLIAIALLGSLPWAAPLHAQADGIISGSVTDGNNKPLPGVSITLTGREEASLRRSTVTDAKGRYEIAGLPGGTFTVTADLPGFSAGEKVQRVTSGRREVWLVLPLGPLEETLPLPVASPPVRILPLQERKP